MQSGYRLTPHRSHDVTSFSAKRRGLSSVSCLLLQLSIVINIGRRAEGWGVNMSIVLKRETKLGRPSPLYTCFSCLSLLFVFLWETWKWCTGSPSFLSLQRSVSRQQTPLHPLWYQSLLSCGEKVYSVINLIASLMLPMKARSRTRLGRGFTGSSQRVRLFSSRLHE